MSSTQTVARLHAPQRFHKQSPRASTPDISLHDKGISDFFERNGFDAATLLKCHQFARSRFPTWDIPPFSSQGYCSYTLAVATSHLLQFRPQVYALNMTICEQARTIFGVLVPRIQYLGCMTGIAAGRDSSNPQLHVYVQERVPGVTLKQFRETTKMDSEQFDKWQRQLMEDLAGVFALSFAQARYRYKEDRTPNLEVGKVGGSLRWRLNLLQDLPDEKLRGAASMLRSRLDDIEKSPWCLTHGDLIPTNIMVDPISGRLTGLVDWAEGEWLPLGVGLFGLEDVLTYKDPRVGFQYCDNHEELRALFMDRLNFLTAHLSGGTARWSQEIGLSRQLGIMLWHGIAFDDGRIDRAVQPGRDDAEWQKLNLFLQG